MASPPSDDPSIWNPTAFIALDDHPSSPPSKRARIASDTTADIQVGGPPAPPFLHHAPISFSSAFSAPHRVPKKTGAGNGGAGSGSGSGGGGMGPSRYANQFAGEALFPFGDVGVGGGAGVGVGSSGRTSGSDSVATGSGNAVASSSSGIVGNPYVIPYDPAILRETAAAALGGARHPATADIAIDLDLDVGLPLDDHADLSVSPAPSLPPSQSLPKGKGRKKSVKPAKGSVAAGKKRQRSTSTSIHAPTVDSPYIAPGIRKERERQMELDGKSKRKIAKKSIERPKVPRIFRGAEEEEEEQDPQTLAALQRGMDPTLAKSLVSALETHKKLYREAYNALSAEVIKIQIEESVLRNIKTALLTQRELMRMNQS